MKHTIALEFQLLLRDRAVGLAVALLAALLIIAVLAGRNAQYAETAALDEAATRIQAEWAGQPPKNPHDAAHYGILVYRPAAPLQAMDPGVLPYQGAAVFLEAHRRNTPFLSPASVRAADGRFGSTRLSPLLQLAGGFFALVIGYLVGARESRRGIAPLLIGVGARPANLIAAKALMTFILVFAAAIPALCLAASGVSSGDEASRFLVLAIASLTHLGTLAALGVAAGIGFGVSRGGLAAVTLLWALGVLIIPRALDIVAEQALPSTRTALEATINADFARGPDMHAEGSSESNEALKQAVLAEYDVDRLEDLPINYDALLAEADEAYRGGVYDRRLAEADARRRAQDSIRSLSWAFSPTPAILDLSARMAGSHADYQRSFDDEAEAFRRDLVGRLNQHMAENSRTGDWSWTAEDGYFSSFEAFDPPQPTFARDLPGALPAVAALTAWSFVALLGLVFVGQRQRFGRAG